MKKLLLLSSLLCFSAFAFCQNRIKETKPSKAHRIAKHKTKRSKRINISHNAPNQNIIDSIKKEKMKLKH
jgi:hypothetical protein